MGPGHPAHTAEVHSSAIQLRRKVHVTPQTYRCTGRAGERALQAFAPEPAPLPRDARRGAGQRWCYGLKARAPELHRSAAAHVASSGG